MCSKRPPSSRCPRAVCGAQCTVWKLFLCWTTDSRCPAVPPCLWCLVVWGGVRWCLSGSAELRAAAGANLLAAPGMAMVRVVVRQRYEIQGAHHRPLQQPHDQGTQAHCKPPASEVLVSCGYDSVLCTPLLSTQGTSPYSQVQGALWTRATTP